MSVSVYVGGEYVTVWGERECICGGEYVTVWGERECICWGGICDGVG